MAWEQLLSIYREAVDEARAERDRPPQACPNDGEPLREAPHGGLYCPYDGWRWPAGSDPLPLSGG